MTLSVVLHLTACPQLAKDSFDKVDSNMSSNGGAQNSTTTTLGATGLILGGMGAGAVGGTSAGGANAGGTNSGGTHAGAPGAAGDGGVDSGGSSTTGGTSQAPTTLIYATTDNSIYAREWSATSLGAPAKWITADHPIAFIEAQMAPDRSWSVAAAQGEGDEMCKLHVFRHAGINNIPLLTLDMGEPTNCLRARGFDIAFEQNSERALLVYALPDGKIGYYLVERSTVSDPYVLQGANADASINWVRAVSDSASNQIAVGFTVEGATQNSLVVREWEGEEFGESHTLVTRGSILDSQSFDFAYYDAQLIALRGDVSEDGIGYHLRGQDGEWLPEEFRPAALNGNAQGIELRNIPTGVAGALFDATGAVASFGTLLWQDGDFAEETRLDNSLPDVSNFESPSLKTDIQRLGNAAVTVYVNEYGGEPDAVSSLGWAVLHTESVWTSQQPVLPMPFEQESRDALTRSIRLGRFEDGQEGLLLAFGEDGGLYVSSLTDLDVGWKSPTLVDEEVDGSVSTPFAIAGP